MDDFGHITTSSPARIVRPESADEVAEVLRTARRDGTPVAVRGQGHSCFGQSQVDAGIVLSTEGLARIGPVEVDRVRVGAGALWSSVLAATHPRGLAPPVLTDYLGLSVGGTLSVGGIGGTSYRMGVQTDTVLDLEVVTFDGAVHTVASGRLFDLVRAGLGQHGVLTAATLRLVPAPQQARRYRLYYSTLESLLVEQRTLIADGRFDFVQGQVLPGWRYLLEAVAYYTPPDRPDDASLLADLRHDEEVVEDLGYVEFQDRLGPGEAALRAEGEWFRPHVWWNAFLPDSTTFPFLSGLLTELTDDDLGAMGCVLVYPINTAALTTPLFRVPDEPVVFLVAILRFNNPADVAGTLAANARIYAAARAEGGVSYPVGAIPYSEDDWHHHFGARWAGFATAKTRSDPDHLLNPGQRIPYPATGPTR